ncbi:MAG: hypothetical protein RLZZ401_437 [Pseudomonadota bacterium]|jgi:type IV pilus assembly protein PilF
MISYIIGSKLFRLVVPVSRFLRQIFVLIAVLVLVACVAGPRGAGGQDQTTDSDESEVRKRARPRLELALGYFEQGQVRVALDEVKQALQQDPAYAEAYNLRGMIYMRLDDMRLAEDSFRQAMALNARDGNTLHNYGWLLCTQGRHADAISLFSQAMTLPGYREGARTLMALGLCQARAGFMADAEASLVKSYALDPVNPVTGYNLTRLLFQRGDNVRAQFYIRRLNNSEYANAESLWLGIKVERKIGNLDAMRQLGDQMNKRFAQSREAQWYVKGSFDE